MKFRDITFRYLKGQKRRSILTIVGIILSVALISGMGTMMVGLREYQIGKTAENNGDYYAQYNGVKGTLVNGITSSKGISRAAVTSEEGCVILTRLSNQERAGDPKIPPCRYVYLTACDSESFSMFSLRPEQGRVPASPGELMLDYGAWEQMPSRPQLGEKVKLEVGFWYSGYNRVPNEDYSWNGKEVFRKKAESEYTLVGLSRARIQTSRNYVTSGFVFLDRQALAANQSYDVFIKTASVINATGQAEAIAQKVGLKKFQKLNGTWSYPITYNDSLLRISAQSSDGTVNNGLTKMVGFIALLVMLCTVAVIYNAFNISVMERISQFGLMRCVGTTPGQIRKIVFQEAAIMSLVGIPVGLACGVLAMKVVMLLIGTMDNNALVFLQEMRIGVSLPVMIVSAVLGIITVILSALGPARKAGQVSPLEAVRNSGSYSKEDFSKVRKQGLASFLPGVTSQMAFKNLRRNRGRFRITVFSMAISIVLYIVFGSFVNFIYTVGGVDRPPNADFLVSIKKGGPESFTAGQYKDMKALPGVERVYKDLSTDVTMGVDESRVNSDFTRLKGESLKAKQGDTILYRQAKLVSYGKDAVPDLKKALKDMSLAEVNRAKGVILVGTSMVNDTQNKKSIIIRPFNYQVGDTIPISPTPGEHWGEVESETVTVLGIMDMSFLDNNYTQDGEILMITTEDVYRQITGSQSFVQMALKLRPGADAEPVGKYLKEWCARDTIYDYTSIAEMVDSMKNAAFTMSVFLYGFVAVIALIGCLNIINTISTNLLLRTRELSILRAVGLTRRGIRKLVATEGTLYGVIAAIYGSIIGTGLAYLLYRIIGNIRGFEWSIPWTQIVVASLGAIVIALISGYIPLKRINEGIIVENLRRVD